MFAPGVSQLMIEYHQTSRTLASLVVSIYLLGYAFGPLLFAPLSEVFGRRPLYQASIISFLTFIISCAKAPSFNALIILRFFAGLAGSVPVTNGAGTITDIWPAEKRGAAMGSFALGPLMGPVVGPITGGFLAADEGWRWVFWLIAILAGVLAVPIMFVIDETYAPVILAGHVRKLRKDTGNMYLQTSDSGISATEHLVSSLIRPTNLLLTSPITQLLAVYMAIVYGYLYLLFTSISLVFHESYGILTSTVGLVYLGLSIGSLTGLAFFSLTSDKTTAKLHASSVAAAAAQNLLPPPVKPEYRLLPMRPGALLLPIGFFLYGWTARYASHIHWIVPIIGQAIIGTANMLIFMCINTYLVDAYGKHSASAVAANSVIRSVAGLPMYASKLGLGWGNSLLGFIAIAFGLVPWLLIYFGERLRQREFGVRA